MRCLSPSRIFAALYALAGCALGGPAAAAPPDEKSARVAEALRELRAPVHEWLGRDVGEKTLAENKAYADLTLAFGLARAGDPDGAKRLLREAAAVLERIDPAHRCLAGLYRHRIEQSLSGKPPVGPLPADLLAAVTPTGQEKANAPVKLHQYIVLRVREISRIVEPLEQVDPYLPWTSKGVDDPAVGRLGSLQDEQDPGRFGQSARALLGDVGSKPTEVRLRVTAGLVRLAPRAGDEFCTGLLKGVPALARVGREEGGQAVRAGVVALVDQSLQLAATLKKPELFGPLVAEAVELIKTERGEAAPGVVARLTVRCERGFRAMRLRAEADAFLKDTAGRLPAADGAAIRTAAGGHWSEAARALLAEAGVRQVAGQNAEAGKLLALVRDVVLDPPAGARGMPYYRLVAEYAAACGRLPPADAERRLREVLVKLARVPNTYTTATHYSRYHLMILEAAVLGMAADDY